MSEQSPTGIPRMSPRRVPLFLALAMGLALQGCARFQQPRPVGEPSPLACYGAKRTREAWEQLIRTYVDEMMAAQEEYSCQPPPPAAPAQ